MDTKVQCNFFFNIYRIFFRDVIPEWNDTERSCILSSNELEEFIILFQKLCILDYVIRNTDRHMTNWLIK